MSIAGFITGILTGIGLTLSIIPFLGWLNWLNIPVAVLGLVLCIVGVSRRRHPFIGTAGIVINAVIILLGGIRLILGGGII
jgi:hypothetical protein